MREETKDEAGRGRNGERSVPGKKKGTGERSGEKEGV